MTLSQADSLPRFQIVLLALVAAAALAVVRVEVAWHPQLAAVQVALEFAAAIGLWLLVRSRRTVRAQAWRAVAISLACVLTYPYAFDSVCRMLGHSGVANEVTMLISFHLTAIVFAAFSFLPRLSGLSVVMSSFLVLFATTMTTNRFTFVVAGCYGVLGLWWLMGAYWDRIEGAFAASSVQRQIPVRASVLGITGLVLCLLGGVFGAAKSGTVVLRGFMPTSGGSHWYDPDSRSGVGDGDAMVAAKDEALSFGPVESDLFLDSELPSLYDMFDDSYGEPELRKRKQQQAIGIDSQERDESEHRIAKTERSGKEFSTVRRKAKRKRAELEDREAPAMFYVVGPTPIHLGLEAYDAFDGRVWEHGTGWPAKEGPRMYTRFAKPWIRFRPKYEPTEIHRGEISHAVKLINLKSNRIPAPPHLTELHIDKVDRISFFGWTKDGMVEMSNREYIPQLTVIHLHSRGINLEPLRRADGLSPPSADSPSSKLAPYLAHSSTHREVAKSWVKQTPPGWLQVEAVVRRLRSDFEHAPEARAPADCEDVVGHFLRSGKGTDYMFATTAASLLRTLGYPTRLVTGFYARPERYSHRAGQTSVLAEDVHVWAEVCVDGGHWVTIEPTPGYLPPVENLTWRQSFFAALRQCVTWASGNWVSLAVSVFAATAVIIWRKAWLDLFGLAVCSLLGWRSPEARLVWTIRLLEWRAFLAGRSRPPTRTIAGWYAPLSHDAAAEIQTAVQRFFYWSDRLLYSPHGIEAAARDDVRRSCSALVAASKRKSILLSLPVSSE